MPNPNIDEEQSANTWLAIHREEREAAMLDALNRIRLHYSEGVPFTVELKGIAAQPSIRFDIPEGPKTNLRQYTRQDQ